MRQILGEAYRNTLERIKVFFWIALAVWVYAGLPPSIWFDVESIHVSDTTQFQSPAMEVDRTIYFGFEADWIVELERKQTDGFAFVVQSTGNNEYSTDAALPEDLDLNWWTYDKDHPIKGSFEPYLREGKYRIVTCWTIKVPVIEDRRFCKKSNTFTVTNGDK